ncbi:hypothetical protein Moror_10834 [Moniliophthora roreri MCA 2997]|uniref:Uncharacterized protein n=1 Tax=Moniliophthora roreri (strain MCA 2997) TaxID=1381753 RepID=V2X2D8_MONRO|nr:hypothetical protein Moror_10834 [Moniliophthora roreri MCA 2997]
MHLPCSSTADMQLMGFPSRFPSPCSLILCFFVAVFLILAIRYGLHYRSSRTPVAISGDKEKRTSQGTTQLEQKSSSRRLFIWDGLPLSLPVTLTAPRNTTVGKGVGVSASVAPVSRTSSPPPPPPPPPRGPINQSQPQPVMSQSRRGPSFEQPLPAIYQSQEPISMAKMIMSRHTFRRPGQKMPRRSASAPPTSSRPQSMV